MPERHLEGAPMDEEPAAQEELEAIELEDDDPLAHVGEQAEPAEDLGRAPDEDEDEADE